MIFRVYDAVAEVAAVIAVLADFDWAWWVRRRRAAEERRLDKAQAMILRAELRAERAEARARELEAIIRQTKDWAEEARKHADATIDDPSNPLPPRFHDLVGWLYAVIGNLDAPLSPQLPLPAELGRSGLPAGEETGPVERALTDERTGL